MSRGEATQIDKKIVEGIQKQDEKAYELLFNTYYKKLCAYSFGVVKDMVVAEEIVQDFIYKLWENPSYIQTHDKLRPYMFRSVYNNSLQQLKSRARFDENSEVIFSMQESYEKSEHQVEMDELYDALERSLNSLPPKTREIFTLNREDDLSYKEIAIKVNLSVKSVEYHISKAMKLIEFGIRNFITILLVIFIIF